MKEIRFTGVDGVFSVHYPGGSTFTISGLFMVTPFGGEHGDLPVMYLLGGQTVILDPRAFVHDDALDFMYNPRKNRNAPQWAKDWLRDNPQWGKGTARLEPRP